MMNKAEYLSEIRARIGRSLTPEMEKTLEYYSEMIDDLIEDGLSEAEAAAKIGTPDEIAAQINGGAQENGAESRQKPKKKLSWWQKLLIILTSPIWLSIIITLASAALGLAIGAFAIYISLWAVIVSLYATVLALGVSAVCGLLLAIVQLFGGAALTAAAIFGAALVCAALAMSGFIGMNQLTRLWVRFSGWVIGVGKKRKEV